jgi:hypothetical protein
MNNAPSFLDSKHASDHQTLAGDYYLVFVRKRLEIHYHQQSIIDNERLTITRYHQCSV